MLSFNDLKRAFTWPILPPVVLDAYREGAAAGIFSTPGGPRPRFPLIGFYGVLAPNAAFFAAFPLFWKPLTDLIDIPQALQ